MIRKTEKKLVKFRESKPAHKYLDGLANLEVGGGVHDPFGLNARNVDYTVALNTFLKQEEIKLCGKVLKVDIVALDDGANWCSLRNMS